MIHEEKVFPVPFIATEREKRTCTAAQCSLLIDKEPVPVIVRIELGNNLTSNPILHVVSSSSSINALQKLQAITVFFP